jgi:hypothetical protein
MANIEQVKSTEWIVRGKRHHLTIQETKAPEAFRFPVFNIVCWYGAPHFIGKEEGYHTVSEAYDVASEWIDSKEKVEAPEAPSFNAAEEMNLVLHREYRDAMDNVAVYSKAYNDLHKKIIERKQEYENAKKYKDTKSRIAKLRTLVTDLEDNREHMYRQCMVFESSAAHMKRLIQRNEGLISGNPDRIEFIRTNLQ